MKKIKKIGFITTLSITLSKIVYGAEPDFRNVQLLYGPMPSEKPILEQTNILLNIGKVILIPAILIIGIFVAVKIKKIKNKKEKKIDEEEK